MAGGIGANYLKCLSALCQTLTVAAETVQPACKKVTASTYSITISARVYHLRGNPTLTLNTSECEFLLCCLTLTGFCCCFVAGFFVGAHCERLLIM